ncbi:sodium-coupled permease [bacterium]|nr:MAG: sodium-coupled permease [bacterium]
MSYIDWGVLFAFLAYTIWDGTRGGKEAKNIDSFFLANRSMPWWAMGLSVMATQASAITFIGTTGQAFTEDMRFVQVYLSMPFAMVILAVTLVPFYYKLKNYSAYEVLESRFGLPTRLLTSALFLISRGLALGTIIAAPSYVLSLLLKLDLSLTIIIIGSIATIYTMFGGISGVIRTDVKQMTIMLFALAFSFFWMWFNLPTKVSLGDALYLAGSLDKLNTIDFTFDVSEKYSVWSGLIAGLFLMLSYFGSDQSQVQRYLTAKSLKDAQGSLLMSAFAKVPMQFFILFLGVLMYVFFIFQPSPLSFRAVDDTTQQILQTEEAQQAEQLYTNLHQLRNEKAQEAIQSRTESAQEAFVQADAAINLLKKEEMKRREKELQTDLNETNYIYPYYILHHIPIGIIGLIIAAIFAAALSSIDSTLNALSTCSIVDWYKRLHTEKKSDEHYLKASRYTTFFWGVLATLSAIALGETKSIIELVNQIGSYFYGSILGVFVLLLWVPRANGKGALAGLLLGMFTVFLFDSLYLAQNGSWFIDNSLFHAGMQGKKALSYLWLNPIGTVVVVLVGLALQSPKQATSQ